LARRCLGIPVAQGSVKGRSFGLIVFFALAELEFSSGNVSPSLCSRPFDEKSAIGYINAEGEM